MMSEGPQTVPFLRSLFHSSDFSKASELAFAHARAMALIRGSEVVILRAGCGNTKEWSHFPVVRKTLGLGEVLAPGVT